MHVGGPEALAVVLVVEPVANLGVAIRPPVGTLRPVTREPADTPAGVEASVTDRLRRPVRVQVAQLHLPRPLAERVAEEAPRPTPTAVPSGIRASAEQAELLSRGSRSELRVDERAL